MQNWNIYIDTDCSYIIKILIFLVGWLGRDQDGRGTRTSEGIKEGAGLQTTNTEIHSQREHNIQGPDPPAFSHFS